MTKTLQELTDLIIEWGAEKGIYKNSSYEYQLNKTLEEVTELHKAILDDDIEQIKDAIGDIYVTLVMAGQFKDSTKAAITDVLFRSDVCYEYESIKHPSGHLYHIIDTINYMIKEPVIGGYCAAQMVSAIKDLAEKRGLQFIHCVEHAYNIISKRKGETINGQFVKDE